MCLPQRRKGAKKTSRNAAALCAAAPLREKSSSYKYFSCIGVKSVVLHRVRIPFVEPFRISNGTVAEKESILVELTTKDGALGWGEASPMQGAFYSAATPESCWRDLNEDLIPRSF